jgi:hypothetical protein
VWLQEVFGWLGVLLSATGAVVSGLRLDRSRWAWLLLAGFLAEATVSAFYRLLALAIKSEAMGVSSVGAASLIASTIGLAGRLAIVCGVSGALADTGRSSRQGPKGETAG